MSQDGWQIEEKTAVVTGTTSGLGKLAALALAEQGARLFLVCRNPDRATRVATNEPDATRLWELSTILTGIEAR